MKKGTYTLNSIRYGSVNGFTTFLTTVASTFWAIFLTDAVGLETAVMATILTLSNFADIISVPIIGVIMQKTNFKGGKFRPWLIVGGCGAALFRWLTFTDLGLTGVGMAIWFCGTYILSYFLFNLAYTAYIGVMPLMAKNPQERVAYSSARVMMNSVGKFIFGLVSVALIAAFSGGETNTAFGYSMFALICALLAGFGFVWLYFITKGYDVVQTVQTDENGKKAKNKNDASIWEMLKYTISVPYLLYLCAAVSKSCIYFSIMSLAAYYYTYVVGNMSLLTVFLTLSTFLMFLGGFITPFLNKVLKGVRNTYMFGIVFFGLMLALAYFIGNSGIVFTVLLSLGYIGYSFAQSGDLALFSAVVDHNQLKTDKDIRPFMMSIYSFTPKIATTVAAAVTGFGLVAIGFSADNVTPEAVSGLRILISALPAILAGVSATCLIFFPISEKAAEENSEKLQLRQQVAKATAN